MPFELIDGVIVNEKTKNNYSSIHHWLRRYYGRANKCENILCEKKSNKYNHCLIAGKEHKRIRSNYIMLCRICHNYYDSKEIIKKNKIKLIN